MLILTLNCRCFSLQYQLFDWAHHKLLATGVVERIFNGDSFITHQIPLTPDYQRDQQCADHRQALELILETLCDPKIGVIDSPKDIQAVGHRVVHGGERFKDSVLIDQGVIEALQEILHLAPLHNQSNLQGVAAAQKLLPGIPQVAIFDTAFHQTMPQAAYVYALPYEWYTKYGIRRYGFHGQSHAFASRRGAELIGRPPEECTVLSVHTGNGVSLCLVKNGVSIDTSMGFSPLEGVMMGTRCGDIDAGIIPFIMREEGFSSHDLELILNHKSGTVGITGTRASRGVLLHEALDGCPRCKLALDMEAYRLKKYLGSYMAVAKVDVICFTYGNGWNEWPARAMALAELENFGIRLDRERDREAMQGTGEMRISADDSKVPVYIFPTGEDLVLNEEVAKVLGWQR